MRDERVTVLGVEPDARMADFARRGGVEVEVATFEAWEAAGRTFDAVIAGQAWHWVDPVAGAAKAAQVLRSGGRLAVFWQVFQPPSKVADAFVAVYQRVVPDSPFHLQAMRQPLDGYQVGFTKAADGIRAVGGFSDPQQWRFDWERSYTWDEWLDQLPPAAPSPGFPRTSWRRCWRASGHHRRGGGSFTMPYTTVAVTTARTSVI